MPKIQSFITLMDEIEADLACVTETWLTQKDDEEMQDIEDRTGYGFFRRDRKGNQRGGGVCIAYRKSHITMSKCKVPNSKFEITAAVERRTGQRRKIVAIVVYVPPKMEAEENKKCLQHVSDVLLIMKKRYIDPYVYLGGDFNKSNLSKIVKDYKDIRIIKSGPTRGSSTLDIFATNNNEVNEVEVLPPIENEIGIQSDHRVVCLRTRMPRVPAYEVKQYKYRRRDEDSLQLFDQYLKRQDWSEVLRAGSPTEKVGRYEEIITRGIETSFREITSKRKRPNQVGSLTR